MSQVPADLRYAKSHEWVRTEPDGTVTVGITDYAQAALGDITYVQLPKVGAALKQGSVFGVVESVKAASDVYAPLSGTVTAVNSKLDAGPEAVNGDPYGAGWIMRVKPSGGDAGLLDAEAYATIAV
ncbi:MAG TPA: glycine cleavage system protein GcvH [Opitutaceae bacterium]|jgi:glycine cleavage system H protein